MNTKTLAFILSTSFAVACGGSKEPAQTASSNAASTDSNNANTADHKADMPEAPKTTTDTTPSTTKPAVEEKVAPAAIVKPKSKWQVSGKSLSDVDGVALQDAAKKAGLTKANGVGGGTGGAYENVSFPIEKGKMKGTLTLVRPTATPNTMSPLVAPSKLGESVNKDTTASMYDADADVFISIEITEGGKATDAKKMLDQLAKKGK
jgi:hypothetical protein